MIVLVDHDRLPTPGQTGAARALKRRSSHQPATSSRPQPPELNRRSTVIHKLEKEEKKVNGPRSPMPKTPALPQSQNHSRQGTGQENYTTPLRSPQPMRSPQTPGAVWHDFENTPKAPVAGGLAVPTADVVKWAANVPLPNTPLTGGFTRFTNPHGNGVNVPSSTYRPPPPRTDYGQLHPQPQPPASPRSHTPTQKPVHVPIPSPSPNRTPRKRASAVVDQAFLDDIQRLAEMHSELDTPPFSKLHSSTRRNLDRLGSSISQSGLPRKRDPSPAKPKMGNVFRLMKDKENQPTVGVEPVLRRKRSVFGGREKERDKENRRESTYATVSGGGGGERKSVYGTFNQPLDSQFKNVPGGLNDGNRRPRRESFPPTSSHIRLTVLLPSLILSSSLKTSHSPSFSDYILILPKLNANNQRPP